MPFALTIERVEYQDNEALVIGRLTDGHYFGPELIEVPLTNGQTLRSVVTGMSATGNMTSWPLEPHHEAVLHLTIYNSEKVHSFKIGSTAKGIGTPSVPEHMREKANGLLAEQLFWTVHYHEHIHDEEHDPGDLMPLFFGRTSEESSQYFMQHVYGESHSFRWPYFTKRLPNQNMVEIGYSENAEFQTRYSIATDDPAGPTLMGYESGHFSLPAFRWEEVVLIADSHRSIADAKSAAQCLLLMFPSCWLTGRDDREAVKAALSVAWQELGFMRAEHLPRMVENIVTNQTIPDVNWTHSEELGWHNNSRYSQRNPDSLLGEMPSHGWKQIASFFEAIAGVGH
jgi:hypothetical protein